LKAAKKYSVKKSKIKETSVKPVRSNCLRNTTALEGLKLIKRQMKEGI